MNKRKTFWIIGYGKYGNIALERLFASFKFADFVVVDKKEIRATDTVYRERVYFVVREGVNFLVNNLKYEKE